MTIDRLEFNYDSYMLKYMKQDKINIRFFIIETKKEN